MSIPLSKKACEAIEKVFSDSITARSAMTKLKEGHNNLIAPKACHTWEERVDGNQFFRKMRFRHAGDYMRGHLHHFDHTTIIFTGSILVLATTPDGIEIDRIFSAPKPGNFAERNEGFVRIRADTYHEIIALEDYTEAWCCFSHKGDHGETVMDYEGNDLAYAAKK